jgi:hypothetical protein
MTRRKYNPRRKPVKDPNVYPPGWNAQRVAAVIKYYDRRQNQPVLRSSRMAKAAEVVWIEIPEDLVPKVQKLIAAHRKSA